VRIRIYRLPGGELPDHVYSGDRLALLEAIDLWDNRQRRNQANSNSSGFWHSSDLFTDGTAASSSVPFC
jgi:hypothetical protein